MIQVVLTNLFLWLTQKIFAFLDTRFVYFSDVSLVFWKQYLDFIYHEVSSILYRFENCVWRNGIELDVADFEKKNYRLLCSWKELKIKKKNFSKL